MADNQGQERLLITCSPLIRSAGVQARDNRQHSKHCAARRLSIRKMASGI